MNERKAFKMFAVSGFFFFSKERVREESFVRSRRTASRL